MLLRIERIGARCLNHKRALLCLALAMGVILILLIPPFDAPDEAVHFRNAWAIGRGQFLTREYWTEDRLMIPIEYNGLMGRYPTEIRGIDNDTKCSWRELFHESLEYSESGEMIWFGERIFSLGYLCSAAGMAIGSVVGNLLGINWLNSPYIQMLLGRFANWVFYTLTVYAALRIKQHFRLTLLLLAAMPMSIFLGASLSYDAMLIPVSLYYFAMVVSHCCGEPVDTREFIRLVLCALLLGGIKTPYVLLLLLLTLFCKESFKSRRDRTVRWSAILLAAIIGVILSSALYLAPRAVTDPVSLQKEYVLSHPFALPGVWIRTFLIDARSLVVNFWGCLGWLDVHIPRALVHMGWAFLLAAAVLECCTFPYLRRRNRWAGMAAAVLIYLTLSTLQYVGHAPKVNGGIIGGDYAYGFQGRYLIPCFLPFLLTFANGKLCGLPARTSAVSRAAAEAWSICCWLITVVTLLFRFWI